jgi:hypothetical protein
MVTIVRWPIQSVASTSTQTAAKRQNRLGRSTGGDGAGAPIGP